MNCKYYCKDYQLEGVCKLHSDWSDSMPIIKYCPKSHCDDYEESKPTYDELYEHWLKTKDRPKKKQRKKVEPEQLLVQLNFFDIIDKKND